MTTTTDGYVFYLNITPERMTHEQINALRAAQDNVQRILGRLSQQADADFQSSPESNDPNPTVRSFGLARALERVFNRSKAADSMRIYIILLAARGMPGLPSGEGIVNEAESFMQLIIQSFRMGGSQSATRTRWIIATAYYWDAFTRRFSVRVRMLSFDITAQMEEILRQGGGKNPTSTITSNTRLDMSFASRDWRVILGGFARGFAAASIDAEEEEVEDDDLPHKDSLPKFHFHQLTYTPLPEEDQ